jgi:uncharacterized membrane protein
METTIVLLGVFTVALFIFWLSNKKIESARAARTAMAALLLFTGVGHFLFSKGMAMMISFLPFAKEIIYLTGIIEVAAAVGILISRTRLLTGKLLLLFFILILPANIYAAYHNVNLKTAGFDGNGLSYLWFRIPQQLFFMIWVYFSSVRNHSKT